MNRISRYSRNLIEKKKMTLILYGYNIITIIVIKFAAIIKTVIVIVKVPRIFKKQALIAARKRTMIMTARTFRKNINANFNEKEKYILISSNAATFAQERAKWYQLKL